MAVASCRREAQRVFAAASRVRWRNMRQCCCHYATAIPRRATARMPEEAGSELLTSACELAACTAARDATCLPVGIPVPPYRERRGRRYY